jgi:hypothetical protein
MTGSDWITSGSMVVTIVATIITIILTLTARRASADAKAAATKVRFAANADRLRSAQEHIRSLPLRGAKPDQLIANIRQEFDITLGALPKEGPGSEARNLLAVAQTSLNKYESALPTGLDREAWQILQIQVQDAISDLTAVATLPGETK